MRRLNLNRPVTRIRTKMALLLAVAAPLSLVGPQIFHTLNTVNAATVVSADSVHIPLYSNSDKARYATVDYGPQTAPYIKTGSARVVVRAGVTQVTAWYLANMPKQGYRLQSKTMNGAPDGLGQILDFVEKSNPDFDVTVTFSSLVKHPQDIAIGYTVTNATPPPRSARSMIPSDVKRVVIAYQPALASGTSKEITRTISDAIEISALVHAINHLPVDIRPSLNETPMYQGGATLRFSSPSQHIVTVKVEMAFNRVIVENTSPLFDIQNHVWRLVSKDVGHRPYPSRNHS